MSNSKMEDKKCAICGCKKDLTKHHVHKGKRAHRDANPFQKEWDNKKTVKLCKSCHMKVHNPAYSYKLKIIATAHNSDLTLLKQS